MCSFENYYTPQPFPSQAHNANSPNHSRKKLLSAVVRKVLSADQFSSEQTIYCQILYDISLVRD